MAIEHNVITDPNIHEPKGISVAAADKVYVANGAGSGAWGDAPIIGIGSASDGQTLHRIGGVATWRYPAGSVYGEMDIISNSTVVNLAYTSATPRATWLSTDANYTKMTGTSFPFSSTITDNITFDAINDEFVVEIAGDYKLDFWGSFLCADANTFVGVKYGVNNSTPYSVQKLTGQASTASDVINLAAAGIVETLGIGDTVQIYIAAWRATGTTTNITFEDGGMTLALLHEN